MIAIDRYIIKMNRIAVIDYPKEKYIVCDDGTIWKINKQSGTIRDVKVYPNKKNGYLKAHVCGKYLFVHRLIAELFCDNQYGYEQVDHIDGNKMNNRADNLEWVTASENLRRAYQNGLKKPNHHPRRIMSKTGKRVWANVSENERNAIFNAYCSGKSINSISKSLNLNGGTVWKYIRQRQNHSVENGCDDDA